MVSCPIVGLTVYHLQVPLKHRVSHAASVRQSAEPIVLAAKLRSGEVGYGEALPRTYVTGEDAGSVKRAVRELFAPAILAARPTTFGEVLEYLDALPVQDANGRCVASARAVVELAVLDAYSRHFESPIAVEVRRWLGWDREDRPDIDRVRCSGVVASPDLAQALPLLRRMRWFGLRDFKLKVGFGDDDDLVRGVATRLRSAITKGTASLRLDANGAWSEQRAREVLAGWADLGIAYVEQPLPKGDEDRLPALRAKTAWRLIHDESLVTMQDAQKLADLGVADCFNIRISKCGGFLPAARLVEFCQRRDIQYGLGCMVGQTSILSAVERRFLQTVAGPLFVESNYGSFLMADDVGWPHLRFGYGGRLAAMPDPGWGLRVDENKLLELSEGQATHLAA